MGRAQNKAQAGQAGFENVFGAQRGQPLPRSFSPEVYALASEKLAALLKHEPARVQRRLLDAVEQLREPLHALRALENPNDTPFRVRRSDIRGTIATYDEDAFFVFERGAYAREELLGLLSRNNSQVEIGDTDTGESYVISLPDGCASADTHLALLALMTVDDRLRDEDSSEPNWLDPDFD